MGVAQRLHCGNIGLTRFEGRSPIVLVGLADRIVAFQAHAQPPEGGSDIRQYPQAALATSVATAIPARKGSARTKARSDTCRHQAQQKGDPEETDEGCRLYQQQLTSPTSAAAGVPTEPLLEVNETRKSNAVHSAANANIAATDPNARCT